MLLLVQATFPIKTKTLEIQFPLTLNMNIDKKKHLTTKCCNFSLTIDEI